MIDLNLVKVTFPLLVLSYKRIKHIPSIKNLLYLRSVALGEFYVFSQPLLTSASIHAILTLPIVSERHEGPEKLGLRELEVWQEGLYLIPGKRLNKYTTIITLSVNTISTSYIKFA